ncbi:MAG: hypothetical protein JSV92_02700 [archaeon]|nr:MAG: hypothetical protein JSV92_02700 [archaeon]
MVRVRTIEDYKIFKKVEKDLDDLERKIGQITASSCNIHNHINDVCRKVDEKIIDTWLSYQKRVGFTSDSELNFIHTLEGEDKIIENLDPDSIYRNVLKNYNAVGKKLPSTLLEVSALNMDKSEFVRYIVCFEKKGDTTAQQEKTVDSLKDSSHLFENLTNAKEALIGGYSEQSDVFDKTVFLYRYLDHDNPHMLKVEELGGSVRNIKHTIESEIEEIEKEIPEIKKKKDKFMKIKKESEISLRWDRSYVDFSMKNGGGLGIPESYLKNGEHYSYSSRLDARNFIDEILEKQGKVTIMGQKFYRKDGKLTTDSPVKLNHVLLDIINEPIHTPKGVVEPSEWVLEEKRHTEDISDRTVSYLKTRKTGGLLKHVSKKYEKVDAKQIYKDVNTYDKICDWEFQKTILETLVREGVLAQDEYEYWYLGTGEKFGEWLEKKANSYKERGIDATYEDDRFSIRLEKNVNVVRPQLERTLKLISPETLEINLFGRVGAGFVHKNNMEVYSAKEGVMTGTGFYMGPVPFEDIVAKQPENETYICFDCEYHGQKAQKELKQIFGTIDNLILHNL